MAQPTTGLQLRSKVTPGGELELSLVDTPIPELKADQVLVRIEGASLNPSDIGMMFGPADIAAVKRSGTPDHPVLTAPIPPQALQGLAARFDVSMPVGNEGAGVVVAAGADAQALIGKTVAGFGGAMYAQYKVLKAADVLQVGPDATPAQAASCFVNPLTALGMVGTMRLEGHTALVHTAAASNLGQMLQRICLKDGIDLVNVVRSPAQARILADIGAKYVVDTSAPTFLDDLNRALTETGATIAFDAIGGGPLAAQLLTGMEIAAKAKMGGFSAYGSTTHKQVYIYGGLNTAPTELPRTFGMYWGLGGFLLTPFMQRVGPAEVERLRQRVADELTTTFASHYKAEISLADVLRPEIVADYARRATGEKYLINPNKGL